MKGTRTISLTLTQRTPPKLHQKRHWKYISRLTSSNHALVRFTPLETRPLRALKVVYSISQLVFPSFSLFSHLKFCHRSTRAITMTADSLGTKQKLQILRHVKAFIYTCKALRILKTPISTVSTFMVGRNHLLSSLVMIFQNTAISADRLQIIKNRLKRLRKLDFLDLEGNAPALNTLKFLYKEIHGPKDLGITAHKLSSKEKMNFLGPRTSKVSLVNLPYNLVSEVLKKASQFSRLQVLTLRRIENNFPADYTFTELEGLRNLNMLREINMILYLGSTTLTENFLRNLKLPSTLEHLYIWLSGACLTTTKTAMRAYKAFGDSLNNAKNNLKFLMLLWDILFDFNGFAGVMKYFPRNMNNIETFHIYGCCTEETEKTWVDIGEVLEPISSMKKLEMLIINVEQLCFEWDIPSLEGICGLRFLYVQGSETSKSCGVDTYMKIVRFVEQNKKLRHMRLDIWGEWIGKEEFKEIIEVLGSLKDLEHLGIKMRLEGECKEGLKELGMMMKDAKYLKERFVEVVLRKKGEGDEDWKDIFRPKDKFYYNWVKVSDDKGKELFWAKV